MTEPMKEDARTVRALRDEFRAHFDREAARAVFSPGRVNVLGEHTDYNDGFVLPAALSLGTTILIAAGNPGRLRVKSRQFPLQDLDVEWPLARGSATDDRNAHPFAAYVVGALSLLAEKGGVFRGLDVLIDSTLPIGGGLSSSASLTVGLLQASSSLASMPLPATDLALLAQRVEHAYAGVPCGIMDQLVIAAAWKGALLAIDCRTLATTPVALPARTSLVVIDSGVSRALASSAYTQRRQECEAVVAKLQTHRSDIRALRDVTLPMLTAHRAELTDIEWRRARHVITENDRCLEAIEALQNGDVARCGACMNASHDSLRDDYEVSSDALDLIVQAARTEEGVHGARLTGAGFGGCVVMLVERNAAPAIAQRVVERVRAQSSLQPRAFVSEPGAGASLLDGF